MRERVTHPSVSWKLTFTFFAEPRSSETQMRRNVNRFLERRKGHSLWMLYYDTAHHGVVETVYG